MHSFFPSIAMLSGYPLSRSQFSVLCYYTVLLASSSHSSTLYSFYMRLPHRFIAFQISGTVPIPTIMSPSSLPPQKKRKLASGDSKVKELEGIEANINKSLAEGGSLNCLVDLLDIARSSSDPAFLHKVLYSLYRSCVSIAASPKINLSKCQTEESKVVRTWLLERIGEFTDLLCGLMTDEEKALHRRLTDSDVHAQTPLHRFLDCFEYAPDTFYTLPEDCGCLVIMPIIFQGWANRIRGPSQALMTTSDGSSFGIALLRSYKDTNSVPPQVVENLLSFLERLKTMPTEAAELNAYWIIELGTKPPKTPHGPNPPGDEPEEPTPADQDDWRTFFDDAPSAKSATPKSNQARVHTLSTHQCLHSLSSHRAQFSACWMTLLPHIASSPSLAARALAVLHRGVMPHMDKPVRLMDWVGGCVDFGGSIGLLALNAPDLMLGHISDFPDFYTRLYAFLTRDVMHLKYRALNQHGPPLISFTTLTTQSRHLPAAILASFIKRLARLSLTAPPAAIIMIIPFVYNVLKRHPALMVMIHRVDDEAELDPFDEKETSPLRTNALESSLWELVSHRDHYLSSVSTLAKIFSEAFTKPSYALEDFLDHTYATLFETEAKRKLKKDPAVALEAAANLFPASALGEGQTSDVVSELWVF
ncbi:ribosome biogenesis protein Noc4 [Rhizoctonia solani AG-1 IA]|uniref:Ribosome biogenesis protein Noc4 n=1 Tax=Thanatephorus cucumeris (strain AG1-IA) TaxID=983506 RepID=L8X3J2_THACA|nr:ribosome biogenesis protein Noc4 [Rhizoctonia solani AG-1 IA]